MSLNIYMYTYKSTTFHIIQNSLIDTITGRQNDGRILNYDNFSNTVFIIILGSFLYTYSIDII